MHELIGFLALLIDFYIWVIIFGAIMSWLLMFGVVNGHNPFVRSIWQAMQAVTEPLLGPIRRLLPNLGSVDISPVVLCFGCIFVRDVLLANIAKAF